MNYASVVFAGFAFISIMWYLVYARKHFRGPPLSTLDEDDSKRADATVTIGQPIIMDSGSSYRSKEEGCNGAVEKIKEEGVMH